MARNILFIDGFDHYGNAGQALGDVGWTGIWPVTTANPRTGTSNVRQDGGSMVLNSGSASLHFITGYAFYPTDIRFQQGILRIYSSAGTGSVPHFSVEVNPAGFLQLYRWPSNAIGQTLVFTSAAPVFFLGTYQYYEIEFLLDDVAGTCNVWREGVLVGTYTGDTRNNDQTLDCNVLRYFDSNNNGKDIDDFYFEEATASGDRLGPIKARTITMSGDTATQQWTIVGGDPTAAAAISHIPQQIGVKDITAPTAGLSFLCDANDLPVQVTSIAGIAVMTFQEKSDAGTCDVQVNVKSGATTGNGNNNSISTGPGYYRDIFMHDPNTGANWTRAGFNAAQFGATRNT